LSMVETYGTHGGADKCKFAYIRAQVLHEVIASNLVPSFGINLMPIATISSNSPILIRNVNPVFQVCWVQGSGSWHDGWWRSTSLKRFQVGCIAQTPNTFEGLQKGGMPLYGCSTAGWNLPPSMIGRLKTPSHSSKTSCWEASKLLERVIFTSGVLKESLCLVILAHRVHKL